MFARFDFHTVEPTWNEGLCCKQEMWNICKNSQLEMAPPRLWGKGLPTSLFPNKGKVWFCLKKKKKKASKGRVLTMDRNCRIQLRKLLRTIPRDFYIHLKDSSLLQRGSESSCCCNVPSRTAWQVDWKWKKAVLSQQTCLFVFYSIPCEANILNRHIRKT